MKVDDKMHQAQVAILHALLFRPAASFAELQKASKLSSDHFNFHLKRMLEQEIIQKNPEGQYELTSAGKEYANRFDTDERVVERQPKVAVLLRVIREDGRMVCQQRLKQPYYGYWGRPTGKIRWGETIIECAARELMEETGLTADLTMQGVYHKIDINQDTKELLEDKIFFVVRGENPKGDLLESFDGGRNAWLSLEEVSREEKIFDGVAEGYAPTSSGKLTFHESSHYYTPDQY